MLLTSDHTQAGSKMPRRRNDLYETPKLLLDCLFDNFKLDVKYLTIFEPCNGNGAISNELTKLGYKVITADLYEICHYPMDARNSKAWSSIKARNDLFPKHEIDVVITNPPFTSAEEIATQAISHSTVVCLLTRLSFLEPTKSRDKFWQLHPPYKVIVNPRTSFTNDGKSDSMTTCWVIWHRGMPLYTPQLVIARNKK